MKIELWLQNAPWYSDFKTFVRHSLGRVSFMPNTLVRTKLLNTNYMNPPNCSSISLINLPNPSSWTCPVNSLLKFGRNNLKLQMQRHVVVGSKWATIWLSVPWPNFIWHSDLNSPSYIKYFFLYIDISRRSSTSLLLQTNETEDALVSIHSQCPLIH